jgi:hypothetical protein
MLLVLNGLLAKFGLWHARRHGTAERLQRLATEQATRPAVAAATQAHRPNHGGLCIPVHICVQA